MGRWVKYFKKKDDKEECDIGDAVWCSHRHVCFADYTDKEEEQREREIEEMFQWKWNHKEWKKKRR